MTVWQLELPVPIYEQSEDSIRFSLVTSRRNCKALLPRSALQRAFDAESRAERGRRYHYYVSHSACRDGLRPRAGGCPSWRSERSVAAAVRKVLDEPSAIGVVLKAVARGIVAPAT